MTQVRTTADDVERAVVLARQATASARAWARVRDRQLSLLDTWETARFEGGRTPVVVRYQWCCARLRIRPATLSSGPVPSHEALCEAVPRAGRRRRAVLLPGPRRGRAAHPRGHPGRPRTVRRRRPPRRAEPRPHPSGRATGGPVGRPAPRPDQRAGGFTHGRWRDAGGGPAPRRPRRRSRSGPVQLTLPGAPA